MSCDLSDPNISEAYEEIISGQDTNWLILGYNDTRDKISLYSKGSGGLEELRNNLREEVLYARALVHGRAVGALFKAHQIQINASTPNDLTEANVRNRLKLGDPSERPNSPPGPKRNQTLPGTPPAGSPVQSQVPVSPISPKQPQPDPGNDEALLKQDSERRAAEDAERLAREKGERDAIAQRKAAEQAKAELDRKNREEAERKRNEELRNKFAELEKSGKFWKRRFFELRGKTLYLFRDETDKLPISKLELDGQVTGVTDAQSEVLILNSFKVDFRSSEPYYFFSDDKKNKELIVAAIGRYAK
ncbi:7260_t:CDS:2 [Cetraspora pellucida]|uniref:7260_t:CDS:1 n=1 Tax=Cetraspora pellucida TaxID=1433469 RepID=A0A9N9AZV9_9GLOM|nr:7260_t:CDS:2 [Cetraspora pellucida]